MGKFWLKITIFAVVVGGVVIAVKVFLPSESEPAEKPKTYYDVIREDEKRLRAEPEVRQPRERLTREEAAQQPRELTIEEQVQAERLFEQALFERKKARLPGMNYGRMVQYCRQIIEKFPGSPEAPKARRMLAEVPEHKRKYTISQMKSLAFEVKLDRKAIAGKEV